MSGPLGSQQWMYSTGFYPYEIDQSLRFNDDDSAYLNRTPASAGNRKTWTWSGWVKRGNLGTKQDIFTEYSGGASDTGIFNLNFSTANKIAVDAYNFNFLVTTQVFRDVSSWYHIVFVFDSTQSTANNRVKLYVNGSEITAFDTRTNPSLNTDYGVNSNALHRIGANSVSASNYLDGYLAEVNFVDGQALDATSFGEFKSDVWIPKSYSGSYGTNGFYLDFGNSGSLGADSSGNGNNWTPNNLAATDQVSDSPTNSFATFNPLNKQTNVTLSEGNLKSSSSSTSQDVSNTTIYSRGKWYAEFVFTSGSDGTNDIRLGNNARVSRDGTTTGLTGSAFSGFSNGDVIQFSVDIDNQTLDVGVNNSYTSYTFTDAFDESLGVFRAGDNVGTVVANFGQDSSFAGNKTAQGNTDARGIGDFYYAPPAGYLALCTANLPDPAIDPAQDDVPEDYFNTVLYTGNGTGQSITGVNFQPDLVWIKSRSDVDNNVLQDGVRGVTKQLFSNLTDAETSFTNGVTSFDSDGFTVATSNWSNENGQTRVAWNWLAGNGTSTNTDGTITSTVSANQKAGFSIVSYTGNGSNATVGHGLSSTPEMIIFKNRTSSGNSWVVYSSELGATKYLLLDSTGAAGTYNHFQNTAPTSSVAYITGGATAVNANTNNYIAYCFHSVDSYSKIGVYTGNGSTDGPFIYTGFRPAFVMIKRTDTTGHQWSMWDAVRNTYNVAGTNVWADSSEAEVTSDSGYGIDLTSNGFKLRNTHAARNATDGIYIYMAFAEMPFKYSNAR